MQTQKEIAKRLIEVRHIMDFLDDGYHIEDIFHLTKISNELFLKLNKGNQEEFRKWDEKRRGD